MHVSRVERQAVCTCMYVHMGGGLSLMEKNFCDVVGVFAVSLQTFSLAPWHPFGAALKGCQGAKEQVCSETVASLTRRFV